MPTGANLVLRPFQQLRQLGDIDGDAPRFGLWAGFAAVATWAVSQAGISFALRRRGKGCSNGVFQNDINRNRIKEDQCRCR